MFEILGNIYDRSAAIVFGTVIFSIFWRLWKLLVRREIFLHLILMFPFYPENGETGSRKTYLTQEWLVVESFPFPYSRLAYEMFPFLKKVVSVIQFSDALILTELLL